MTSRPSYHPAITRTLLLASLTLLTACGGGTNRTLSPGTPGGEVRALDPQLEAALCDGRAESVVHALTSEPLSSATDQFYTGLALEEMGALPQARQIYALVMQSASPDSVQAKCGNRILADGPVSDEAARHLARLSQQLAALDVNLAPPAPLHEGLPAAPATAREPARSQTGALTSGFAADSFTYSYDGEADQSVSRPASQSPLGQWFAHLASYSSVESATENSGKLEKKFPGLAGILDQWELEVGGKTAVRIGVRVRERSEADTLCNAVKSQGEYCAVIDTSS